MKKLIVSLLVLLSGLSSCSEREVISPSDLSKERSSGVVLIANNFFYAVHLPGMQTLYFTGIDEQTGELQGLTTEQGKVAMSQNALSGTGFFVGNKGEILTNRHVVKPQVDKQKVQQIFQVMLAQARAYYESLQAELGERYTMLDEQKETSYFGGWEESENNRQVALQQAELERQYNMLEQQKRSLASVDMRQMHIELFSRIGVAYDGMNVRGLADFESCNIVKVSEDANVDLALIQLKDQTPPERTYVFNPNPIEESPLSALWHKMTGNDAQNPRQPKIDDKVTMIGYNAGLVIANTSQGIRTQTTSGAISQDADSHRLLYTIPSLQGSSGSPVLNEFGELVAVNFAGMANTQSFNYGIRLEKVLQFLNAAMPENSAR